MKQIMKILTLVAILVCVLSLPSIAQEYSVIEANDIEWGLLNPLRGDASPKAADLWGDRTRDTATGMLVKFEQDFSSPAHIHNVSYRGIVIEGLVHNDDPTAAKMWLPTGSFWTQPAGENHITAANGASNLIYLEIDSGPYLVHSKDEAVDNGERPINMDKRNLVWLNSHDLRQLIHPDVNVVYLWKKNDKSNGSLLRLPAGFKGSINNIDELKIVTISGTGSHKWNTGKTKARLSPSSFISSKINGTHRITVDTEMVLYINSNGTYSVESD